MMHAVSSAFAKTCPNKNDNFTLPGSGFPLSGNFGLVFRSERSQALAITPI